MSQIIATSKGKDQNTYFRAGLSLLNSCHACMFWFRMNNICDNRQEEMKEFPKSVGRLTETSLQKRLSQIPIAWKDCQIV